MKIIDKFDYLNFFENLANYPVHLIVIHRIYIFSFPLRGVAVVFIFIYIKVLLFNYLYFYSVLVMGRHVTLVITTDCTFIIRHYYTLENMEAGGEQCRGSCC